MDKALLVSIDVENCAQILAILDAANLKVSVALWLLTPDYEDHRFVLAARAFDKVPLREAFGMVHDALDAAGFGIERTPPLLILRMTDPFVRALLRTFGKARSVPGMRLGRQTIGDRWVEDAYVYRVSTSRSPASK